MNAKGDQPSWLPRTAAIFGTFSVVGILLLDIVLPNLIAGTRVSGTTDATAIRAYYSHAALAPLQLLGFVLVVLVLVFAYGLREVLSTTPRSRFLATLGLIFVTVEMPVLLVQGTIQAALVYIATSGGDPVPLFRFWDILYNSAAYALEAAWILTFSLAMRDERRFPRWIWGYGALGAGLQGFNMCAIFLGVPDSYTILGNVVLVGWFVISIVSLFRRSHTMPEQGFGVPPPPAGSS